MKKIALGNLGASLATTFASIEILGLISAHARCARKTPSQHSRPPLVTWSSPGKILLLNPKGKRPKFCDRRDYVVFTPGTSIKATRNVAVGGEVHFKGAATLVLQSALENPRMFPSLKG